MRLCTAIRKARSQAIKQMKHIGSSASPFSAQLSQHLFSIPYIYCLPSPFYVRFTITNTIILLLLLFIARLGAYQVVDLPGAFGFAVALG
jgi:hypothetical protein